MHHWNMWSLGARVNAKDNKWLTPLHRAVASCSEVHAAPHNHASSFLTTHASRSSHLPTTTHGSVPRRRPSRCFWNTRWTSTPGTRTGRRRCTLPRPTRQSAVPRHWFRCSAMWMFRTGRGGQRCTTLPSVGTWRWAFFVMYPLKNIFKAKYPFHQHK